MIQSRVQHSVRRSGLTVLAIVSGLLGLLAIYNDEMQFGLLFLWLASCTAWGSWQQLHLNKPERMGDQVTRLEEASLHERFLVKIPSDADPVHRQLMGLWIGKIAVEFGALVDGRAEFPNTESWRTVYEKLLRSPDVAEYHSVAWVKSEDYWQDLPGEQSLRLNYECLERGVRIERILILGWNLWPAGSTMTLPGVRKWIEEQHYRGVDGG